MITRTLNGPDVRRALAEYPALKRAHDAFHTATKRDRTRMATKKKTAAKNPRVRAIASKVTAIATMATRLTIVNASLATNEPRST